MAHFKKSFLINNQGLIEVDPIRQAGPKKDKCLQVRARDKL